MKLARLKRDITLWNRADEEIVVNKGTTVQIVHWSGGYRLLAPGGLYSFVYKHELDNVVEFLDDETGHT